MSTKFPDIFQALAAPFDPAEVKTRPGDRGRRLSYITARTVMNRLDEVLGPENWWDAYFLSPVSSNQGVLCQLTIRLPDGQTVTKQGIGGVTTMHDPSDTDKTAESDSCKRAAVKFGVGRYLYQDGTSSFDGEPAGSPPTSSARPAPTQREGSYQSWLTSVMSSLGMGQTQIWELHNYIIKLLKESNYEFGCDIDDRKAMFRVVAQMYEGGQATEWLADAVERFKVHKK